MTGRQRSFIYVLQHAHEQRIKIGRSVRPDARAQSLPDAIDFERSFQMAVSHSLSREIEKALHEIASDFSILAEHRGDGYTEWFDEKALPLIRSFIEKNALLIEAPTGIYDHTRELSIRLTMPQWRALKVLSLETDASLQELTIEAFNLVLKANGMPQLDQS